MTEGGWDFKSNWNGLNCWCVCVVYTVVGMYVPVACASGLALAHCAFKGQPSPSPDSRLCCVCSVLGAWDGGRDMTWSEERAGRAGLVELVS